MKFGRVAIADADGALLGHTLRAGGRVLKKGRRLAADDLAALRGAGHDSVVCARLEEGDVGEDAAAQAVAQALAGAGVQLAAPFTGRCNLLATARGLAQIDRNVIDRINAVDEAVTVATLPPASLVEAGEIVATVKVIPLAVAGATLEQCIGSAGTALAVTPLTSHRIGLVVTRLPGTRDKVIDRAVANMRARIDRLGSELAQVVSCAHDQDAVAAAIGELADCSPILLLGASAIVDRGDVLPVGLRLAGGEIEAFGMPVDPGNLLLLGRLGERPVIGVPGCARSLKPSGFDWVLQRLLAGRTVGRRELAAMGVGGLLADIASRPQPRQAQSVGRRPPRLAAVVLAAGQSRRMGPDNKLLADIDGQPMVRRVVDTLSDSPVHTIYVVVGHEADRVRAALAGCDVRWVDNPDYAAGMGSSVAAGVAAAAAADGVVVCLGDMPWLRPGHLAALVAAFDPVEGRAICVPTFEGKRGNPVLFGSQFFPALTGLSGDIGARRLIADNQDAVEYVEVGDRGVLVDVDTAEALAALRGEQEKSE